MVQSAFAQTLQQVVNQFLIGKPFFRIFAYYEQLDSPLVADNHNMGERSDLVQRILGLLIHRTISLGR